MEGEVVEGLPLVVLVVNVLGSLVVIQPGYVPPFCRDEVEEVAKHHRDETGKHKAEVPHHRVN